MGTGKPYVLNSLGWKLWVQGSWVEREEVTAALRAACAWFQEAEGWEHRKGMWVWGLACFQGIGTAPGRYRAWTVPAKHGTTPVTMALFIQCS